MKTKKNNRNLNKAKKAKNDEFYTKLSDIENELSHYRDHFKNKIVYCNCDDPYRSNFVQYFALNFKFLGLKQLVATCYKHPDIDDSQFEKVADRPIKWVYNGEQIEDQNIPDLNKAIVINLKGDGDFRSEECLDILKDCDIVVTNPPFSLFRDFVNVLIEHNKQFLIIGNQNAITYKEVFPLLRDDKVWLGYDIVKQFIVNVSDPLKLNKNVEWDAEQNCYIAKFGNICWFTNLEHDKRNEEIILYKKYNKEEYPTYDNYNAINVNKIKDIPCNYKGIMGVPITFIDKYNPKQFEILDLSPHFFMIQQQGLPKPKQLSLQNVGRKNPYARILVRNRKPQLD